MEDLPQAEFDVMDVLWRKGDATIKEVQAELSHRKKLAYTTVATLLTRLREKGFVEAEEKNFAYVFRPLVKREEVVKQKLDDFVSRIFHGSVAPLAAYLAENSELNDEQIKALEDIVKSAEREGSDNEQ